MLHSLPIDSRSVLDSMIDCSSFNDGVLLSLTRCSIFTTEIWTNSERWFRRIVSRRNFFNAACFQHQVRHSKFVIQYSKSLNAMDDIQSLSSLKKSNAVTWGPLIYAAFLCVFCSAIRCRSTSNTFKTHEKMSRKHQTILDISYCKSTIS